jgi:hypothetical protein
LDWSANFLLLWITGRPTARSKTHQLSQSQQPWLSPQIW